MRILHTIPGFGSKSGGTTTCTYDLLRYLRNIPCCEVDLLTPDVTDASDTLAGNGESWIKVVPNDNLTSLALSHNLKRFLCETEYDIYQANGLWMYSTHITALVARQRNKPFVLTPHGMLYPDALARSAWKKKLMGAVWFNNDIKRTTCMHATCKPELDFIRQFGYKGPIALIPNPVPFLDFCQEIEKSHKECNSFLGCSRTKSRIGFLGRLHPIKNVDRLIKAWALLGEKVANAELIIMGSGDAGYEEYLRSLAGQCRNGCVSFLGFVSGREKFETLASLTALCVPSDFENFGMIVTEALAVGTPVIANYGTPWEELNTEHCGWWIDASEENIAESIESALNLSEAELKEMGDSGKRLVAEKYAADKVAAMMQELYCWLMGDSGSPDFVDII